MFYQAAPATETPMAVAIPNEPNAYGEKISRKDIVCGYCLIYLSCSRSENSIPFENLEEKEKS
jgi:hypothetical protein